MLFRFLQLKIFKFPYKINLNTLDIFCVKIKKMLKFYKKNIKI